jgi:hypothetical protein
MPRCTWRRKASRRTGWACTARACAAAPWPRAARLSWLSQSIAFAGSRQYAEQKRYDIMQLLPARILGADGIVLDVDPDATHPDRDGGLFTV